MTKYLLDTNIISNITKKQPSEHLARWMMSQVDADLYISVMTLAEIERGILGLPMGRRRESLASWFHGPTGPGALLNGRILAFDEKAASIWAELVHEGKVSGHPRNQIDMVIAATAKASDCVIASNNVKDFYDLCVVDPTQQNGFSNLAYVEEIRNCRVSSETVRMMGEVATSLPREDQDQEGWFIASLDLPLPNSERRALSERMKAFAQLVLRDYQRKLPIEYRDDGSAAFGANVMTAIALAPLTQHLDFDVDEFRAALPLQL